jgi:hypothetical protein
MKKVVFVLFLAVILMGSSVVFSQGERVQMVMDESLFGENTNVLAAWLAYGTTKSLWVTDKYLEENPDKSKYQYSFQEELDAREALVQVWKDLKKRDENISDKYLNSLIVVKDAGFLDEYVWHYFQAEEWGN